jgi:hypothetical protein
MTRPFDSRRFVSDALPACASHFPRQLIDALDKAVSHPK